MSASHATPKGLAHLGPTKHLAELLRILNTIHPEARKPADFNPTEGTT